MKPVPSVTASFAKALRGIGFVESPATEADENAQTTRYVFIRPAGARGHTPGEIRVIGTGTVVLTTFDRAGVSMEIAMWPEVSAHTIARIVNYCREAVNAAITERNEK